MRYAPKTDCNTETPAFDCARFTDIEHLLIWVYRDQLADVVISRGVGLHDAEAAIDGLNRFSSSADGIAMIAKIGTLGTRVDGGGSFAAGSGALHPLAERVHEILTGQGGWSAFFVMQHARAGSRPDPMIDARIRYVPSSNKRYYYNDKGKPIACRITRIGPLPETVDMHRRAYRLWHDAIVSLWRTLRDNGIVVDPIAAGRAPWEK